VQRAQLEILQGIGRTGSIIHDAGTGRERLMAANGISLPAFNRQLLMVEVVVNLAVGAVLFFTA
jgi:hypothetical protein